MPTRGVVAIGQFGVGLVSLSHYNVAGYAFAHCGLYLHRGRGLAVASLRDLLAWLLP